MNNTILVAGVTGNLGERIVKALVNKGAEVRALVRSSTGNEKITALQKLNVKVFKINSWNRDELVNPCRDVHCVVSALAGLRDVIIEAQKVLLDAAIAAGVPRFIPSDYSLDFTKFSEGENRNLDMRREFHQYLKTNAIASTSIFNGAFTELLTDQMPVIFFKKKLILYWGDANKRWDFTTMDNTAEYTANAALDTSTPRYLRIAGDRVSPTEIKAIAEKITGEKFRMIRTGGKGLLGVIIKIAKIFSPSTQELYPAWQGMQYMHNMIDKRSEINELDNERYAGMKWMGVEEVLGLGNLKKG